jgi:hypothetical protein
LSSDNFRRNKNFIIIMKVLCLAILVIAITAKAPTVTPTEVEEWISAFAHGAKIDQYSNTSAECTHQLNLVMTQTSIAVNQFSAGNTYVGLLNLTTGLGMTSNLTRQCVTTVDELGAAVGSYVNSFDDFSDFVTKIGLNCVGNLYTIKQLGEKIFAEYILDRNMTAIMGYAGQMAYTVFHVSSGPVSRQPLTYTETNPLASNPMKSWAWVPLESAFHFLTRAQLTTEAPLAECEGSTANFFLDIFAGFGYEKNSEYRNMVFAFSDAMTYSHGMVEGCHDTGVEIGATWGQINQQVFKQGKFWSNLFGRIAGLLLLDGTFLASQIYYGDYINLFGAAGDMFNRVLVKGLQPAQ